MSGRRLPLSSNCTSLTPANRGATSQYQTSAFGDACKIDRKRLRSAEKTKEQIRRHYVRSLRKVDDESDTIILVLGAHEGYRARLVEEDVRRRESVGEKLIFVLNKWPYLHDHLDLVPRENAALSPTLHPYSSILLGVIQPTVQSTSATASAVLRLLKAYKPSAAQSVTIGVVGFPICSQTHQGSSDRRPRARHQDHRLTGVVVDEDEDESSVSHCQKGSILPRNVVEVEDVEHPITVVEEILIWTGRETLQITSTSHNSQTSLTMLAVGSERLLKGGTPDVVSAAQQVLMDWNYQGPILLRPILDPPVLHTVNGAQYRQRCRTWSRDHRPSSNPNRVVETVRASRMIRTRNGGGRRHARSNASEKIAFAFSGWRAAPRSSSNSKPSVRRCVHAHAKETQMRERSFGIRRSRCAYYPFNRKVLKGDAMWTRRAATKLQKSLGQMSGMEVDELLNTFKLGVQGPGELVDDMALDELDQSRSQLQSSI
ncbi:hypothetical protein BU15DRAFT_67704 [Melanogaster broomeanus]|nr:hypothetical protein BU15DRAFT_67704 [Melanogaster broomeanus]